MGKSEVPNDEAISLSLEMTKYKYQTLRKWQTIAHRPQTIASEPSITDPRPSTHAPKNNSPAEFISRAAIDSMVAISD